MVTSDLRVSIKGRYSGDLTLPVFFQGRDWLFNSEYEALRGG